MPSVVVPGKGSFGAGAVIVREALRAHVLCVGTPKERFPGTAGSRFRNQRGKAIPEAGNAGGGRSLPRFPDAASLSAR
jgi:hypothetical protein